MFLILCNDPFHDLRPRWQSIVLIEPLSCYRIGGSIQLIVIRLHFFQSHNLYVEQLMEPQPISLSKFKRLIWTSHNRSLIARDIVVLDHVLQVVG